MKVFRVAVLLFAVAVIASRADETNVTFTVDGVTYSNVTFSTVTLSSVSIRHKTGAASIPLAKLPPELQKQLGYDPQREADWQAAQRKAAADRAKAEEQLAQVMAKSRLLFGEVIQVMPEGLLMQTHYYRGTTNQRYIPNGQGGGQYYSSPGPAEMVEGPVILVVGHPKRGQLAEGAGLSFYGYPDGTWKYHGADGTDHTVQRCVYVSDEELKK